MLYFILKFYLEGTFLLIICKKTNKGILRYNLIKLVPTKICKLIYRL